jgi:ketosteroid isomerase-like protein
MVYHRARRTRGWGGDAVETEASRQLVRDYYAALRSGDAAALARVLADDLEWIPPRNGRDYSNEYAWIFTCADGRIVRLEEHVDTLRFQRIALEGAPA